MERTKTLLVILFVVAAFALLFASVRSAKVADQSGQGLTAAGDAKTAPDFTLLPASGSPSFHLQSAVKAQPIVLDFWATWCGPCQQELPHIEALSQKYRGRVGVYGVNSSDPPAIITPFAKQKGLTFPTLSDPSHSVAALYGADAIPLLVVIDTQGRVRLAVNGYDPNEDIEASLSKTLDTLLAEQQK